MDHYTSLARLDHAPSKSWVRKVFDKISNVSTGHDMVRSTAREASLTVRQYGTGVVAGAAFGAIHAELKGGLDPHGIPLDGATALIGGLGAIVMASEEWAPDLRNLGTAGATIYAFRKTDAFLSQKKAAKIAGETDMGRETLDVGAEDPIVSLARQL